MGGWVGGWVGVRVDGSEGGRTGWWQTSTNSKRNSCSRIEKKNRRGRRGSKIYARISCQAGTRNAGGGAWCARAHANTANACFRYLEEAFASQVAMSHARPGSGIPRAPSLAPSLSLSLSYTHTNTHKHTQTHVRLAAWGTVAGKKSQVWGRDRTFNGRVSPGGDGRS